MSNHGQTCRDGIFGNLQIKGAKVIDEQRNIKGKKGTFRELEVKQDATFKGTVDLSESCVVSPLLKSNPLTSDDLTNRENLAPSGQNLYDIIVCGAGTAGSLLVYRLAERYPNAKILVLDMGKDDVRDTTSTPNPNDPSNDWGQLPRGFFSLFGEGGHAHHGEIKTRQGDEKFRTAIHDTIAGTLGGNSSSNAMVWNRGTKEGTYDRWENVVGSEFGFDKMNDSYKALENRTQTTRIFGSNPFPYWVPDSGPTPGQTFNPEYHGNAGKIFLAQNFIPSSFSTAINEVITDSPLPGRTTNFDVDLDAEDPNNPVEYSHFTPQTQYDQSDPNFPSRNPYPVTTPGYTYTPPNDPGNAKGPEYGGFPLKIVNANPAISSKFLQTRCYASPAFLYPIIDSTIPHNVTIKSSAFVTKLLFENSEDPTECTGVEWVEDGWHVLNLVRMIERDVPQYKGTLSDVDSSSYSLLQATLNQANVVTHKASAKSDVWVCLGAKHTPKLLQQSGIGPRSHLESIRLNSPVPVKVDLPGVGAATQDTLDMGIGWLHEVDTSTDLPSPLPAATLPYLYGTIMGAADPTDPFDPYFTNSIGGSAYNGVNSLRIKTDPTKKYSDMSLLTAFGDIYGTTGNGLWENVLGTVEGRPDDYNVGEGHPNWDRYRWGFNDPNKSISNIWTNGFLCEYWDMTSQGEVKIKSGNPYDPVTYAPAMGSNEADIEAMVSSFKNTVLPLCQRMGKKKFGPRGLGTYVGVATAGGANTIDLAAVISTARPFDSSEVINQATYDTAGSLNPTGPTSVWVVSIVGGTGAGQNNAIVSWAGSATYQATMLNAWNVVPDNTSVYFLNPPDSTPVDTLKYDSENNRNFARFVRPSGDDFLSAYAIETITDPLTTTAYVAPLAPGLPPVDPATRVSINQTSHGLSEGDFIKISGISSAVDSIPIENFNDYHIVDNVVDTDNYEIVLFWNQSPIGGPGSSKVASPAVSASGVSGTGGDVTIEKMTFNETKFRKWLERTYASGWHACCSCRMGNPDDSMAVVDTRGRVYNTKGLRISDCSIFPIKPNCNTQAPAYGITQRLFELVSAEEYDNFFL